MCSEDARLTRIETAVHETRERVFNGLSSLPQAVEGIRKLVITLLVGVLLGGLGGLGYWIYKIGRLEVQIENHIEWTQTELQSIREDMR